jgi:hypothetical protein
MSGRELDAHAASPADPYPHLPALRGGVVERASLEVVPLPGRVDLQVVDARGRVVEVLELEPGVAADLATELAKNAKEAAPENRKLEYEALEEALEDNITRDQWDLADWLLANVPNPGQGKHVSTHISLETVATWRGRSARPTHLGRSWQGTLPKRLARTPAADGREVPAGPARPALQRVGAFRGVAADQVGAQGVALLKEKGGA